MLQSRSSLRYFPSIVTTPLTTLESSPLDGAREARELLLRARSSVISVRSHSPQRGTLGAQEEQRQRPAPRDEEYVLFAPSSTGPGRRRWATGTERSRNASLGGEWEPKMTAVFSQMLRVGCEVGMRWAERTGTSSVLALDGEDARTV